MILGDDLLCRISRSAQWQLSDDLLCRIYRSAQWQLSLMEKLSMNVCLGDSVREVEGFDVHAGDPD